MRVLGFEYDNSFEGLLTPWSWLDKILCKIFGCPDRRYYDSDQFEFCSRCGRDWGQIPADYPSIFEEHP